MGTTLANIQVRGAVSADLLTAFQGVDAYSLSDGWTTLLNGKLEVGKAQRIAKKLSGMTDNPILSVEYFDEDILVLGLFAKGVKVAYHVSNSAYGMTRKPGIAGVFLKELGLDLQDAAYLKAAFQCEDLCKQISMLESIFACPLIVDRKFLDEMGQSKFQRTHDLTEVSIYLAERQQEEKIKNLTRISVLSETEGLLDHNHTDSCSVFAVMKSRENGRYYRQDKRVVVPGEDGHLQPFLNKDITFNITSSYSFAPCENRDHIAICASGEKNTKTLQLLNRNGETIVTSQYEGFSPLFVFQDGSFLQRYEGVSKIDRNGKKVWSWSAGYTVALTYHGQRIYMFYYDTNSTGKSSDDARLVCLDLDGNAVATNEITQCSSHMDNFIPDGSGCLYYCCTVDNTPYLYCFDRDFRVMKKLPLNNRSTDGLMDSKNGILYLVEYEGLCAVDVRQDAVLAEKRGLDYYKLLCITANGNLVVEKGYSTILVYNNFLELIGRHRLKGSIRASYWNVAGQTCILTFNSNKEQFDIKQDDVGVYYPIDNCVIRLYELME